MSYNSENDVIKHKGTVHKFIDQFCIQLVYRAIVHDSSKLESPEKSLFDKYTPKLKNCTYGSEEYKQYLKELKPALKHHYENNSHHPEHYENGLDGFDLFDLIEMLMDWMAATLRHDDGDIFRSLEINKDRFNISDQLYNILKNTLDRYLDDLNYDEIKKESYEIK